MYSYTVSRFANKNFKNTYKKNGHVMQNTWQNMAMGITEQNNFGHKWISDAVKYDKNLSGFWIQ